MTPFRLLAQSCGLSLVETASYCGMPKSTTNECWYGRRNAQPTALAALHSLSRRIDSLADSLGAAFDSLAPQGAKPASIVVRIVASDKQAQQDYDLPFASCHVALLGRAVSRAPKRCVKHITFSTDIEEDIEVVD